MLFIKDEDSKPNTKPPENMRKLEDFQNYADQIILNEELLHQDSDTNHSNLSNSSPYSKKAKPTSLFIRSSRIENSKSVTAHDEKSSQAIQGNEEEKVQGDWDKTINNH